MKKISKIVSSILLISLGANATTLKETVNSTLNNNSNIKAIMENNNAYRMYIDEVKSGYYPKLDIQVTGETKRTDSTLNSNPSIREDDTGYNTQLTLEQLIYDGGLTSGRIDEAIFREERNKYSNYVQIDNTITEGIKAYLDLVKYSERLMVSKKYVEKNEEYMKIALKNEEISGNSLDKYEVKAKLHQAKTDLLREKEYFENAKSIYKRVTGNELKDNVCLPKYEKDLMVTKIENLVESSLKENNEILSQLAKIQENREKINQEEALFLPTLKFYLTGSTDKNLIESNTDTNIYSAKMVLNYNLFNGGANSASKAREKYFLQESQQSLDEISHKIVENVNKSFTSYKYIGERITQLQEYLVSNEEVLRIYDLQFQDGTRTFVDVLDKETELYNAKIQYINENVSLTNEFFTLANVSGKLQNNISNMSNESCSNETILKIKDENNNLELLSKELGLMDKNNK